MVSYKACHKPSISRLTDIGCVTVGSCASQLLYEIQGPLYYNCDVTADLTNIVMEQIGEDRVRVTGVKGLPPPPTTKVGITAPAGWQCEYILTRVKTEDY